MPRPAVRRNSQAQYSPGASNIDNGAAQAKRATAFYEAGTVNERIRRWQMQEVEDRGVPDALSTRSGPRSEAATPIGFDSPVQGVQSEEVTPKTQRQRSTKWVQKEDKGWIKQRKSVKDNLDKVASSDTELHTAQPKYSRTESQISRNVTSSRTEREERRRRRREHRARENNGDALVDDGIRVYNRSDTDLVQNNEDDQSHQAARNRRHIEIYGRRHQHDHPQYQIQLSFNHDGSLPSDVDDRQFENHSPVQPSKYAQTLGQKPKQEDDLQQQKTRRRVFLNKTKDLLAGRAENGEPSSNRMPSIEAWLDDQPVETDPQPDNASEVRSSPNTKRHRHKSSRRSIHTEPTIAEVTDPNKIWDAVAPELHIDKEQTRKNKRKSTHPALQSETASPDRRLFSFEGCEGPVKGEVEVPPPTSRSQDISTSVPMSATKTRRSHRRHKPSVDRSESASDNLLARHDSIQPERDISPHKPAGVSQNRDIDTILLDGQHAPDTVSRSDSQGLKRKLTTHEDLLSVLSQNRTQKSKSKRSVRFAKVARDTSPEAVIKETFKTIREEEAKYMRELKTLVDGVTPVLLQSLLSKTDASATADLFFDGATGNSNFTRAVIDMGVALQRLKKSHDRMRLKEENVEGFLTWASATHKAYTDYVKAWRLGFQDVVVNLAPLEESETAQEDMLARDVDGDVMNDSGEKADVAYLQKRPLVRIKRLSKHIATIRSVQPNSEKAIKLADLYADLTEAAKQKHSEEQGRIEDEAAAAIDNTRARDIKTMAPFPSTRIEKNRNVRARDMFTLSMLHSSGQRLDCGIEIILRDSTQPGVNGDILICQVEADGKWLLFQPVLLSNVSARRDQDECELVIMLKGAAGIGQSWHEILLLRAEDAGSATEWLNMLGSNPLPPRLNHTPSWRVVPENLSNQIQAAKKLLPDTPSTVQLNANALASLPSDVDVPIGEPSVVSRRPRGTSKALVEPKTQEKVKTLSMGGGLVQRQMPEYYQHAATIPQVLRPRTQMQPSTIPDDPRQQSNTESKPRLDPELKPLPLMPKASLHQTSPASKTGYGSQSFAPSSYVAGCSARITSRSQEYLGSETQLSTQTRSTTETNSSIEAPMMTGALIQDNRLPTQGFGKQLSQDRVPSTVDSPATSDTGSRSRSHSRVKSFSSIPLTNAIREQWSTFSGFRKRQPLETTSTDKVLPINEQVAALRTTSSAIQEVSRPPSPPQHRTGFSIGYGSRSASAEHGLNLAKIDNDPQSSSDPAYDTSGSGSSSSSDYETDDTDATSDVSDDDFRSEVKDQATPLVALGFGNRRASYTPGRPLPSLPPIAPLPSEPSSLGSLTPHKRAAQPAQPPPPPIEKKRRAIAIVCSWSDRGIWEPIREDECSIVVSAGLIQAFPMSAAHSKPLNGVSWTDQDESVFSEEQQQPLVEFELTPIVPLRKGTALDITIRSPPTANAQIRTTNNVMFRSRTVPECDQLYHFINWSRCNNQTYAQLARERSRAQSMTFAQALPETKTRSWFSFGAREKKSYRAGSKPPSSIAESAASNGSLTNALTALKKFGQNSPFSLQRSSVIHRPGMVRGGVSLYSSSNGDTGGSSTPASVSQAGFIPGAEGPNVPQTSAEAANGGGMVNNMKVKLFVRQGQKWEALGSSLLTVLPALAHVSEDSRPGSSGPSTPTERTPQPMSAMPQPRGQHFRLPSSSNTPHKFHGDGREKRILITSSKKSTVLLDETLPESCFEKVMQTGIALNVWKEDAVTKEFGGVMTGRSRTYMIQFRTSTEATWVFNLCGTYRYNG